MASVKLYLDTRSAKKNGKFPLKVSVNRSNLHTYIPLDIDLLPGQFMPLGGKNGRSWVTEHTNRDFLNRYILSRISKIEEVLMSLQRTEYNDAKTLRLAILHKLDPEPDTVRLDSQKPLFSQIADACVTRHTGRTREMYANTVRKVREFCQHSGTEFYTMTFEDMTRQWLFCFQDYCINAGNSTNTIAIEMRNIRHIFNFALDEELAVPYPFKRFKISYEETPFLALTAEQMHTFITFECSQNLKKYKDMFLLIFYLIGINIVDLFNLKKTDLVNGRISYRRAKTSKLYSIKVYPEAQEIIQRHQGNGNYLLDAHDTYSDHKNYLPYLNDGISAIAAEIGGNFPNRITTYWARYSWVNIAHRLNPGVPKDDISIALGHVLPGSKTTNIYLHTELDKADQANRRVIDAVTKNPGRM